MKRQTCWRRGPGPWVGVLLVCIVLGAAVFSGRVGFADVKTGPDIEISGTLTQQQFLAGRTVRILADVSDSVFVAGREVTASGARAESFVAAAADIRLDDSTMRDLIAAGTDITLDSTVEDDVVAAVCPVCWWASGRFALGPGARVGDELVVAAGTVELDGEIGGNVRALARRIVVSGTVSGRADLRAEEIVIASGAELGGELIARSPSEPQIAADATVNGPVRTIKEDVEFPEPEDMRDAFIWAMVLVAIATVFGVLLLGVVMQAVMPSFLHDAARGIRQHTWSAIGRGLVWTLLLSAVAGLAASTIIGIPIAVVLAAVLVLFGAAALVAAAYAIGLWLRSRKTDMPEQLGFGSRAGWTLLGLAVLVLVGLIPVVGSVLTFIALLAGFGAVAGGFWRRLSTVPA